MTGGGFGGSVVAVVPAPQVDVVAAECRRAAAAAGAPEPQILAVQASDGARRLQ
jgi:galactokinase